MPKKKGLENEFALYDRVERLAKEEIMTHRKMFKPVCANVDFYSGFVYTMLGIPEELFTPIFLRSPVLPVGCPPTGRTLLNAGKIIRPAYKYKSDIILSFMQGMRESDVKIKICSCWSENIATAGSVSDRRASISTLVVASQCRTRFTSAR